MLNIVPIVLALVLAVAAIRNKAPQNLPLNTQDGALYFPIICNAGGLINDTFTALFTGTVPAYGGIGQDIYYTEVTAQITVPSNVIFDLAPFIGITQASALVHVALQLTNASPATLNVFPNGYQINNIPVPFNQDIVVNVPGNNAVIPPIGPITLGQTRGGSNLYLGEIDILLSLQNAQGQTLVSNVPITCPVQDPDIILGIVSIEEPAGLPPASYVTGLVTYPALPLNHEVGSFRIPYSCDFTGYGSYNLDLAITGAVKTYVAPAEQYYLYNASAFLRVPPAVVSQFKSKYPSLEKVQTTVDTFFLTNTFASPSEINALSTPLTSTSKIRPGGLTVPIPEEGLLQIGPITASNSVGETAYLGVGTASGVVQLLSASGANLGSSAVSCSPVAPIDLIGFPITNLTPGQS